MKLLCELSKKFYNTFFIRGFPNMVLSASLSKANICRTLIGREAMKVNHKSSIF